MNRLVPRPVHQDSTTALLEGVENPQETDMSFLAEDLARERWSRDLTVDRTARLAGAIRRRRAAERSRARARLLLRLASAATRRSEEMVTASDYSLAR